MGNPLYSLMYLIVLFFVWFISFACAWAYVIIMPFQACCPCGDIESFLRSGMELPRSIGQKIRDGKA
eukprot:m.69829 g.69829  ORF g.69829 m.69829 type:complete len:67 (-) comp12093_c0_seq1:4939-5139(-)